MEDSNLIGMTLEFEDEPDETRKFGQIVHVSGDDGVIRLISKEKAGSNPRRVRLRAKL